MAIFCKTWDDIIMTWSDIPRNILPSCSTIITQKILTLIRRFDVKFESRVWFKAFLGCIIISDDCAWDKVNLCKVTIVTSCVKSLDYRSHFSLKQIWKPGNVNIGIIFMIFYFFILSKACQIQKKIDFKNKLFGVSIVTNQFAPS